MMSRFMAMVLAVSLTGNVSADVLPGFSLEKVANAEGFVTSLALDANWQLHYSVRDGRIFRLDDGASSLVATVSTWDSGNAALLGIAFSPSGQIVTHHVAPDATGDIVASVDPITGLTTVIAFFPCPGNKCFTEHHGGNPHVLPDGTIFVSIGDLGGRVLAQNPSSVAGKIFTISPQGEVSQFALGFRNPFDLAWDEEYGRLIAGDNGGLPEDEICFVRLGENHAWPLAMGNQAVPPGMTAPVYVFEETIAPTGLTIVTGDTGDFFFRGVLVGGWVTRSVYYFPSYGEETIVPPAAIVAGGVGPIIDIVQGQDGSVYIASTSEVFHLTTPALGDANGDGLVNRADLDALSLELMDEDGSAASRCHEGSQSSTLGADVNRDGQIDALDVVALQEMLRTRRRGVRRP